MADSKVSQLTAATTPLAGTELVYLVQGGNSRRATAQDIAGLVPGADLTYDAATRLLSSSTGADVTLPVATASLPGLMAAADKALTDALIAAGVTAAGSVVTIPHIHGDLAGSVYIHVKNTSGGQLVKGTPVRVTGAVGDTTTLEVAAADATTVGTMPAIGILGDTLANNGTGHAVVGGELTGLATGSYSIGQALYVASGGGLTGTKPTIGTVQQVAIVGRVHASTGSVTVTIGAQLSPNWDTAYSERLRWDGGATGLDAATGRASLGLGGAATLNVGTTAGTVAAGDDSRITGALSAATAATTYQPLDSDLTSIAALTTTAFGRSLLTQADAPATRSTLGLGSLATQSGTFSGTSSGTNTGDVTLAASVADVLSVSGQELQADDPGADRLVFWDDSAGKLTHLTLGTNLTITGTTLDAAGGSTDLGYTASTRLLTSSTGADVTLPLATTSDPGLMAAADKAKLDGVAAGATANSTDAQLRDRSTHTGTQSASTITGLATVATTGAYADLTGKPTIPAAADAAPLALGAAAAIGTSTDYAREDHVHARPSASDIGAAASGAITGSGLTMATARLLGRSTASTGAVEEISVGSGLSLSGGTLSATGGGGGGLTHFVESESTASPNATVPVDALTATDASYTNIDVAIVAKGTGALLAQVPDGTTAGGNKRGTRAIDWQRARSSPSQVASANASAIGGGTENTASGAASVVSGGQLCTASANWSAIAGGHSNTASSSYSFVGGGLNNTAQTNTHATVCGGNGNTASGLYAFVGGGNANSATASRAVVIGGDTNSCSGSHTLIGGGYNHNASGSYSFMGGGVSNVISSNYSGICGGSNNTANGENSFISGGSYGNTRSITGYHVFPACSAPISSAAGRTQSALLLLGRQTTDATATVLTSNTSAAGTTNQVILPNNSAYSFSGEVIAGVTGAGDTARWTINGAIKRGASAATTAMVGTPTVTMTHNDAGAAAWTVAVTADTTNGGIKVEVTGAASTTIRWVCKINTTEMTF